MKGIKLGSWDAGRLGERPLVSLLVSLLVVVVVGMVTTQQDSAGSRQTPLVWDRGPLVQGSILLV